MEFNRKAKYSAKSFFYFSFSEDALPSLPIETWEQVMEKMRNTKHLIPLSEYTKVSIVMMENDGIPPKQMEKNDKGQQMKA